jgi:hypothetical protein
MFANCAASALGPAAGWDRVGVAAMTVGGAVSVRMRAPKALSAAH